MQDKNICQNCGAELNEENKYMDGMCMECKCGVDWNSPSGVSFLPTEDGLQISDCIKTYNNINPYLLFGVLTINHRTCEDIFAEVGSIIDKLSEQIQFEPSSIDSYVEDTSCLKDIYNKLSSLEVSIKEYKDSLNKFIEDGQDSHER